MSDVAAVLDELWRAGAGPDDRARLAALAREGTGPAPELDCFATLIDLMQGTPTKPPRLDGPPPTRVLGAAAAVWTAALARDPDLLDHALGSLEHHLGTLADDDPRAPIARAWADLALAEAALAAAERATARHRLEAVARSGAPVPLRVAATLRIVTLLLERADLDQARARCRAATSLAEGANRPLHAQTARITGAMLDFVAGDAVAARRTLRAEAERGPLGLLPRVLLSSFEPPERAMPLLAEGLRDAGERGDPFAFTMCTLVGARRYAQLDRDADALLALVTGIHQLREPAPGFADALEAEREELRRLWGPERYAAAEQAAIALLDAGR